MKICPICSGNNIIMFDADEDMCQDCEDRFPALPDIPPVVNLKSLLADVEVELQAAAKGYGAPLKLIIDSRGKQYAFIAYGSNREQFNIDDLVSFIKR